MYYPLVTSLVLVYKRYDHLFNAISSIMNQDYPNIEIIVSDDGSGDFPLEDVKIFIEENKKDNVKNVIINVNEKNMGTVKHVNKTIKMSSGEYFIGVPGDDEFFNTTIIRSIVDEFIKTDALIITTRRNMCSDGHDIVVPNNKQFTLITKSEPKGLFKLMSGINLLSSGSTYYSRKLFDEFGYFDEEYVLLDDYPKYLSLLRNEVKIHAFDIIAINYNIGGVSTKGHLHPQMYRDGLLAIKKEIIPYMRYFNFFERRRVKYQFEYFKSWEKMNNVQRLLLKLRYIDAVLYRMNLI